MEQPQEATLSDLKEVLKDTLEARGALGQIKARIRAEVFSALDDHVTPKPKLSNENLVINELIREYLEYNGYRHALSVFLPESGQPSERAFNRSFLQQELRVEDDPRFNHVPLLYSIIADRQRGNVESGPSDFANEPMQPSMTAADDMDGRPPSRQQLDRGNIMREPSPLAFTK